MNPLEFAGAGPIATRTSSGSLTVTYPTGVSVNDFLWLVEINAANQNITTPAGWTLLTDAATSSPSQFRVSTWWRLAAGETTVSLTVNTNSSGANATVLCFGRASGYPPVPVLATAATAAGTAAASASLLPAPDLTTNHTDATVVSLVTVRSGNPLGLLTPGSFSVVHAATQTTTGQAVSLAVADTTAATPATVGSPTWAQSGGPAQWAWATVAIA